MRQFLHSLLGNEAFFLQNPHLGVYRRQVEQALSERCSDYFEYQSAVFQSDKNFGKPLRLLSSYQ